MSTDRINLVEAFDAGMAEERARSARVMAQPRARARRRCACAERNRGDRLDRRNPPVGASGVIANLQNPMSSAQAFTARLGDLIDLPAQQAKG
jgi:hypothetical protein